MRTVCRTLEAYANSTSRLRHKLTVRRVFEAYAYSPPRLKGMLSLGGKCKRCVASWRHVLTVLFVCVEVLRPSQPNGAISSAVSLPNHTFTGQA